MNRTHQTTSVRIRVLIPVNVRPGHWSWEVLERLDPLGEEIVQGPQELARVLRVYGAAAARMVRPWEAETFTVLACEGEHPVGRDQWIWDPRSSAYYPHGEPWCVLC